MNIKIKKIKILLIVILMVALSSCTMISKEMLPHTVYRENPIVEVIEYSSRKELWRDCYKLHKSWWMPYKGCTWVPYDPTETCTIRVMIGDKEIKRHELWHCYGFDDTFLFWKINLDFYKEN